MTNLCALPFLSHQEAELNALSFRTLQSSTEIKAQIPYNTEIKPRWLTIFKGFIWGSYILKLIYGGELLFQSPNEGYYI